MMRCIGKPLEYLPHAHKFRDPQFANFSSEQQHRVSPTALTPGNEPSRGN
jgi:hypothetical protein